MIDSSKITLTEYRVWDLPVRLFHWINVLCVLALFFMGMMMSFKAELGITSLQAKINLKTVHVLIGYVFVTNLLIRLLWAFVGNAYARWSGFLPKPGLLPGYLASLRNGHPQVWAGHNPLGRLAVTFLYLLLLTMAVSGLVRAGTDIYFPPLGGWVQEYVAAIPDDASQIKPYDESLVDPEKFAALKDFKKPFGEVHEITAWVLLGMLILHIAVVILTETREGGALISAMFTGKKVLRGPPVDKRDN